MAKLTRKSYKRKKVAFAAVIFGGVALVSSGFAAWVISAGKKADETGSVTVGQVVQANLGMKIEWKVTNADDKTYAVIADEGKDANKAGNYSFNCSKSVTSGRFRYGTGSNVTDGSDADQCLSLTFRVTVTSSLDNFGSLNVTFANNNQIDSAVEAKYISAPKGFYASKDAAAETQGKNFSSTTTGSENTIFKKTDTGEGASKYQWVSSGIEVAFNWGEKFDGNSPEEYYNTGAGSTTDLETAIAVMNAFRQSLNGTQYTINFSAKIN